jgi:hypothetical protein
VPGIYSGDESCVSALFALVTGTGRSSTYVVVFSI